MGKREKNLSKTRRGKGTDRGVLGIFSGIFAPRWGCNERGLRAEKKKVLRREKERPHASMKRFHNYHGRARVAIGKKDIISILLGILVSVQGL